MQSAELKDHRVLPIGAGNGGHIRVFFPGERAAVHQRRYEGQQGTEGENTQAFRRFFTDQPLVADPVPRLAVPLLADFLLIVFHLSLRSALHYFCPVNWLPLASL